MLIGAPGMLIGACRSRGKYPVVVGLWCVLIVVGGRGAFYGTLIDADRRNQWFAVGGARRIMFLSGRVAEDGQRLRDR